MPGFGVAHPLESSPDSLILIVIEPFRTRKRSSVSSCLFRFLLKIDRFHGRPWLCHGVEPGSCRLASPTRCHIPVQIAKCARTSTFLSANRRL